MSEKSQQKPNDYLRITVNGEARDLFMSGGMVRQLAPFLGQLEALEVIYQDTLSQNEMIVEMLRPRNKRGQELDNHRYTIDDFEISQEDTNTLVMWMVEHVLHFFVDSVTSAQNLAEKTVDKMKQLEKLMLLLNGSQDSQAKKLSAGPSEQSQVK